jgi:alpha-tubulin suppressor-like RCC1 family protein
MRLHQAIGCALFLPAILDGYRASQRASATASQEVESTPDPGNPHFSFLPPLGSMPKPKGAFDPSLSPVVRICEWSGTACGATVAEFTTIGRPDSETIKVDRAAEHYAVDWRTSRFAVRAPATYRIDVVVGGTSLGHVDLKVVHTARELKEALAARYPALLRGRTLAVRFRIERGAVFLIGPAGGTITAGGGQVELVFPPGAVSAITGVTITPAAALPAHPWLVPGTCFQFQPSGKPFSVPVSLKIGYQPANVPPGATESGLRLHRHVGTTWQEIPGSSPNLAAKTVAGPIAGFSHICCVYTPPPAITPSLSAGHSFTCGITGAGTAYCWGDDTFGELGRVATSSCLFSNTTPTPCGTSPVAVSSAGMPLTFASVSAGTSHACGLTTNREVYCWGRNAEGQLGNGSTTDSTTPVKVASAETFTSVSAGGSSTCATTLRAAASGAAYCWGDNRWAALGAGSWDQLPHPIPQPVTGGINFASIATSGTHTCGLAAGGDAYCWGINSDGHLGNGSFTGPQTCFLSKACSTSPVAVSGANKFKSVHAADTHTCGLKLTGEPLCWGLNDAGQLGTGSTTGPQTCGAAACSTTPVAVVGGHVFDSLDADGEHSCGVKSSGEVFCWGSNLWGQLGDGTTTSRSSPVKVGGAVSFISVSAGQNHTCARNSAGQAYCWGRNDLAELGLGSAPAPQTCTHPALSLPCSTTPVAVSGGILFTSRTESGRTRASLANGSGLRH